MHVTEPEHALPQRPQLEFEVLRFTSQPSVATPLQSAKPVLQVKPHAPAEHVDVALARVGHTLPQRPQLVGSVERVEHDRVHMVWPAPHVARQVPSPQSWPAVHARPHEPQLAGSLAVTTHAVPQRV